MCDPATLMLMAGTAVSAYGKISAGNATGAADALQSRTFSASADLLETQAEIAKSGAALAYARGRVQEGRIEQQGRDVASAEHLHFASNNLDPAYGSPLLLQAKSAMQVETDLNLVRAGEAVDAADALTKSANLEGQAMSARASATGATSRGIGAVQAGYIGAATDLLKGASSFGAGGGFSDLGSSAKFGFSALMGDSLNLAGT